MYGRMYGHVVHDCFYYTVYTEGTKSRDIAEQKTRGQGQNIHQAIFWIKCATAYLATCCILELETAFLNWKDTKAQQQACASRGNSQIEPMWLF